jgi:hypothetical protein
MGCGSSHEAGGTLITEADIKKNSKQDVHGIINTKYRENRGALSPKSLQLQPPPHIIDTVQIEEIDLSINAMIEKRSILSNLDHELLVKKISLLDKKTLVDLLLGTDLIASTDLDDTKSEEENKDESKAEDNYPKLKAIELEPETEPIREINIVSNSSDINPFNISNNVEDKINEFKMEKNDEENITVESPNNTVTTNTIVNSKFSDDVKKKIKELAIISKELIGENVALSTTSNVKHFADVVNVTKAPLKLLNRRNKAMSLSNNTVNNDETKISNIEAVSKTGSDKDYIARRILLSAGPSSSIDYLSCSEFIRPNRESTKYDYGDSRALPYEVTIDSNYNNSIGSNFTNAFTESGNYGDITNKGSMKSNRSSTNTAISSNNIRNIDIKGSTYPITKTENNNNKSLNTSIDGGNSRFNEYSRLIQLSDKELYEEYTKCTHLVNAGTTFNSRHELCLGIVKYKFQDRLIIQKKSSVMIVGNVTGSNTDDEVITNSNSTKVSNIDVNKFIDKTYLFGKNVDDVHETLRNVSDDKAVDVINKVTSSTTDNINRNSNSSISIKQKSLSIQNNVTTIPPGIAKTGSSLNKFKKVIVKSESERNRNIMLKKKDNYIPDKITPLFSVNASNTIVKSNNKNVTTTVPKKIQQLLQQKGKFGLQTPGGESIDSRIPKSKLEASILSPIAIDNASSPNYISY